MSVMTFIGWSEVETLVARIGKQVRKERWRPGQIVALGRGGMVPARLLADFLAVKEVELLPIARYKGTKGGRVRLNPGDLTRLHGKVLLVDDICDRGETLRAATDALDGIRVRTATLHYKSTSTYRPDFTGRLCDGEGWLVYPWEHVESAGL